MIDPGADADIANNDALDAPLHGQVGIANPLASTTFAILVYWLAALGIFYRRVKLIDLFWAEVTHVEFHWWARMPELWPWAI